MKVSDLDTSVLANRDEEGESFDEIYIRLHLTTGIGMKSLRKKFWVWKEEGLLHGKKEFRLVVAHRYKKNIAGVLVPTLVYRFDEVK